MNAIFILNKKNVKKNILYTVVCNNLYLFLDLKKRQQLLFFVDDLLINLCTQNCNSINYCFFHYFSTTIFLKKMFIINI